MKIVFAAGCFWGVEKAFRQLDGVINCVVGYADGEYANPTYEKVIAHRDNGKIRNHIEVIKINYDESKISTENIIKFFWQLHNPTQINAQGNDVGSQYRSAILYITQEQRTIANNTKNQYQELLTQAGFTDIATEIKELDKFYPAEEYHQDYLTKNPNGYCHNHSTGVKF